ncbi:MAG TPA: AMP-binding protein [Candidatus Limnocylindrales bacterium]|nr:AMP-binding protein [Candidatus Limnocylindrales bacterium]
METLLDLVDDAMARFGDRPCVAMRLEDGTTTGWTYQELDRRSRAAALRLRGLGLEAGDRLLTWSPSAPELVATYLGAMRAGIVYVPLDLRMSKEAIEGVVTTSGAKHLAIGTGRDAPDPAAFGLGDFPRTTVDEIAAPPDPALEARLADVATWPRPRPQDLVQLIFTSGTTGTPKGVMLAHDNLLASNRTFHRIIPPMEHRIVSLLPLSHLLEQAVGLFYAMSVGASILYVRSRNPRVIFDALREHRVTSMVVVPQVLELFWSAIEREVEKAGRTTVFDALRSIGRRLPMAVRRRLFRQVHASLGGAFRIFVSAGAFLPPALQQAWEDMGVIVLQGYGATETGTGSCTTLWDHGLGTVGRPPEGIEMRLAPDGEVQFRGPTLFKGYWNRPELTAASFTDDGWYMTGDVGHLDPQGRLILSGRKRDLIVLPNGFNVYPEDIENALRIAGLRDSVVLETKPGRVEAILLVPSDAPIRATGDTLPFDPAAPPADVRTRLDTAIKAANASLGANQHISGWRLWPEMDFPRTHTLKVKRDVVRAWVRGEVAASR